MKQRIKELAGKIAARSERERVLLLLGGAMLIVFPFTTLSLQPMWQKKIRLERELVQQGARRDALIREGESRVLEASVDPDAALRARLAELQQQNAQARDALRTRQKGLVAPEAVVPLLQHLLRSNGKLQLLSLRTLPVVGLSGAGDPAVAAEATAAPPAPANAASVAIAAVAANATSAANGANATTAASATTAANGANATTAASATTAAAAPKFPLYRHGVEIVLQGTYLDMLGYLDALEAAPGQLFWSKAELDAEAAPNGRLTLILYTVSLDKKWIAL